MNTFDTPRWVRKETVIGILHSFELDSPAVLAKIDTDAGLFAVERALVEAFAGDDEEQDETE